MQPRVQELSPLLRRDDRTPYRADDGVDRTDTNTTEAAHPAGQLSDALERKLNSQDPIDRCKLYVTSSTYCHAKPRRFWSPSLERRRESARPTPWASMFDFRSDEIPVFRSKLSLSPESSTAEGAEGDTETSRKESIVARHCTRQLCLRCTVSRASSTDERAEAGSESSLEESVVARHCTRELCCEYFRRFIAFFFSTVGSCVLMVSYVILGGMIFQRLEAEQGRAVDLDMQRVKDKHISWLWNLTAAMNVLHPLNWSATAFDVLDSYTSQVTSIQTHVAYFVNYVTL